MKDEQHWAFLRSDPIDSGSATYNIVWRFQIGSGPQRDIDSIIQKYSLEISAGEGIFKITKGDSGYQIRKSTGEVEPAH